MRRRRAESGFALLLVFAMAASAAILLYLEMPRILFEAQRRKEHLLVERGEQYKRGIQLFVRKFKRYPATIDELEKTQDIRFLRRRFKDPMTGKDEWRLIHIDAAGMLTDSLIQKPPDPFSDKEKQQPQFAQSGFGQPGLQPGQPGMPAEVAAGLMRRASDRPAVIAGQMPAGAGFPGQVYDPSQPYDPNRPPDPNQTPDDPNRPFDPNQPSPEGQPDPSQGQFPGQQPYPGQQAFPGQQLYPGQQPYPGQQVFPGQQPYPGQQLYPGQQVFPGQQLYPGQQPYPGQQQNPGQPAPFFPGQQIPGLTSPAPFVPGQVAPGQIQPGQIPGQPYVQPGQPSPFPLQQIYPQQQPFPQQPPYPQQVFPPQGVAVVPGQQPGFPQGQPNPFGVSGPIPPAPTGPVSSQGGGIMPVPIPGMGGPTARAPGQPGATGNAAIDLIRQILTTPRPGGLPGAAAAQPQGMGAGIAGVASQAEGEGIVVYNERTKFKEWEFVYDYRQDKSGAAATGQAGNLAGFGAPGGPGQGQGQGQGQQPASPFGMQPPGQSPAASPVQTQQPFGQPSPSRVR